MKRLILSLAALALAGCEHVPDLEQHPLHCAAAVEVARAAMFNGIIPNTMSESEIDELIHRIQAGLYAGGICPSP